MKINRRISSNIELFEQKINYEFKNKEYILEAVSYTHLDVYKRQIIISFKLWINIISVNAFQKNLHF